MLPRPLKDQQGFKVAGLHKRKLPAKRQVWLGECERPTSCARGLNLLGNARHLMFEPFLGICPEIQNALMFLCFGHKPRTICFVLGSCFAEYLSTMSHALSPTQSVARRGGSSHAKERKNSRGNAVSLSDNRTQDIIKKTCSDSWAHSYTSNRAVDKWSQFVIQWFVSPDVLCCMHF